MKSTILLTALMLGSLGTHLIAKSFPAKGKGDLESMTAQDTHEITIVARLERADKMYNQEIWDNIFYRGLEYIKLCNKACEESEECSLEDDCFIDHFGKIVKELYPLVKQDNSGVDGNIEVFLSGKKSLASNTNKSNTNKQKKNFSAQEAQRVAASNVKKVNMTFSLKKDAVCNEDAWQEIFDVVHTYALDGEKCFDENCDTTGDSMNNAMVEQAGDVVKTIYQLAKPDKTIHGELNISIN